MADNKFLPKLSQNLLEILNDNKYYDINIEVGNDPHTKIFHAHMVILNYRCPYLLSINNQKKNDGILAHIKLPNILPETFQIILRYIYGGRLSLEEYDTSVIIKILVAAKELDLQELITYLQLFLIEQKTNWMERNFDLISQTSFESDSFLELQRYCTDLISEEPDKIFKSLNFCSIPEKLLVSIIQNDNLQMSEIQIWEHVLEWGLAQNSGLPSDPTSFIPFIRFYNLTSKEFLNKVFPYRKILSEDLFVDLLRDFLNHDGMPPSNKSKPRTSRITNGISSIYIDSNVIALQHAELILKWINRLNIMDKLTSSYEFKLLLRGSRDGFTHSKFHQICDDQSKTITIIKVKGSSEILGGYNPISWNSINAYSETMDSFIFSFKDKESTENYTLSRAINKTLAILNSPHYGPSFGTSDLILYGNNFYEKSSCTRAAYEKSIRSKKVFSVEEYEIFQIIKN